MKGFGRFRSTGLGIFYSGKSTVPKKEKLKKNRGACELFTTHLSKTIEKMTEIIRIVCCWEGIRNGGAEQDRAVVLSSLLLPFASPKHLHI